MHRTSCLTSAALALSLAACGSNHDAGAASAPPPPPAPARQYIVGVDISGSRTPTQLAEGQALLGGLIDRMTNGDRIVIVETYQAGTDAARQWNDSVPARRDAAKESAGDKRRADDFRQDAKGTAAQFFDSARAKEIKSTDIFGTLQRAADYAKSGSGRPTTLLLLSDMIQSTPELSMERVGAVPGSKWIAERKAQGRLPDLRGVCVVVDGADVSSRRGAAIREFWKTYFAATGADFREGNYRNMISNAGEVGCG